VIELVLRESLEPIRCQVGVAHRMSDILMSEAILQRSGDELAHVARRQRTAALGDKKSEGYRASRD